MKTITHRDQIHGDVRFDPLAVALLNTPALQRLGRIYQLGFAHLVYRGGTHTRLSHVMGAYHVADRLVELLRRNYTDAGDLPRGAAEPADFLPKGPGVAPTEVRWDVLRHLVRWAAVLHDIGHVPLGHTLEDEFDGIYAKHDDFASPRIAYLWCKAADGLDSEIRRVFRDKNLLPESFRLLELDGEQAWQSVMLICLHKESVSDGDRLSFKDVVERSDEATIPFIRILKEALLNTEGRTFFPYMADIVGNTICADYLDYLRRDPSNVGLDVLRDDRVASRFYVGKTGNGLFRMALALEDRRGKPRLDTCTGVVELVRQRFRFAEVIYYHKTKVAASAMLAKVFTLIGKPEEVGPEPLYVAIDQVTALAEQLERDSMSADDLREKCFPAFLLNPEIGDETLLLWLQDRAWKALAKAKGDKEQVARCLRGISLLQAIARRSLYKVCFTIDRNAYARISPGSSEDQEVERRIQDTLKTLRKNEKGRADLESRMAAAAGWPEDSLLLYVPPRKSQAKGIETRALDKGDVVTLGEHSAVKKEVAGLNDAYKGLWRIILLVHPNYSADAIGLSRAVDSLVKGIWPTVDRHTIIGPVRESAWFHYISEKGRPAAAQYNALVSPSKASWSCFEKARDETVEGTASTEEHAQRAVLLGLIIEKGGGSQIIKDHFGTPNSLTRRLDSIRSKLSTESVRDPEVTDDPQVAEEMRFLIERVADEIMPKAADRTRNVRSRATPRTPAAAQSPLPLNGASRLDQFTAVCRLFLKTDYSSQEPVLIEWYDAHLASAKEMTFTAFLNDLERSTKGTPAGKHRPPSLTTKDRRAAELLQFLDGLRREHNLP